ncbi:helix-turn-helix domain-containing protein [Micromonospora radicis]|uniref:helix-turn-helix domain-containing protein n=1 Tax=Micromonospora radicis TaxID=1894971 RepID=UPI0013140781|nr:helix-turn-helix transcriptional regulator [Micromonospora radicis]
MATPFDSSAFEDEFAPYLAKATENPEVRAAYEDAQETHKILDSLVALRRALRLTQTAVARRMGIRQPAVSEFETEASDPRLSTIQRYARAVEGRIRISLELPAECDWVSPSVSAYSAEKPALAGSSVPVKRGNLARAWGAKSEWDLTA